MGMGACADNAAELAARAQQLGYALLLLTIVFALIPLLLVQVRQALGRSCRLALLLPLAHPGWWLRAQAADCGATLLRAATGATVVAALVVIALLWRGHTVDDRAR